jgi:hypothetical protein
VLSEALIEVEGDADVVALVFEFEDIDDGEDDDGFKVHGFIYILDKQKRIMDDPQFVAQAVKYYTALLEAKKKAWRAKNPNPRPRGRPRKGGGGVVAPMQGEVAASNPLTE